ncbi:hypothetical protein PGT21_036021 [Puccinia graminis f. sp. tritici]|uniref:Uncharacterized protein n=1 Tax=Puccinia graminis f. sp. tritici TaxID=56615 RepID=A0A5B0PMB9_PUCGR|nr:hypothetical protein PGT21_036021 [Puccinia graminis f. sp. tritici]
MPESTPSAHMLNFLLNKFGCDDNNQGIIISGNKPFHSTNRALPNRAEPAMKIPELGESRSRPSHHERHRRKYLDPGFLHIYVPTHQMVVTHSHGRPDELKRVTLFLKESLATPDHQADADYPAECNNL